jgi:hypothetical protein
MPLQVTLRDGIAVAGVHLPPGSVQTFADEVAHGLVDSNKALPFGSGWAGDSPELTPAERASVRSLVSGAGNLSGVIRLGNINRIRAALSAATTASPATILALGDSTRAGNGAGAGTQWTDSGRRHTSAQFAAMTNGLVSTRGFYGDAGVFSSPGLSAYNLDLTVNATKWSSSQAALGGNLCRLIGGNTSVAGDFRLNLPANAQKVRVYSLNFTQAMTVQTNLGVIGSTPATNTGYIEATDFTVQPGATYVEIVGTATLTVYIAGLYVIDTVQKAILINAGLNGAKVSDYITSAATYDPLPSLKRLAPALTIINLTINDSNAATALATYQAGLSLLAEAALISGDVALEFGFVSNTTQSTDGTLYAVRKAVAEISEAYNLSLLSLPAAVGGSWANANASGYVLDTNHLTYTGYGREAQYTFLPFWNSVISGLTL